MRLLLIAFEGPEATQGAGFAQSFGMPFDVLCVEGKGPRDTGAERVFEAGLAHGETADGLAKALAGAANGYSHLAAVSSMRSKDVLPRVAAHLGAAMVTDAISASSPTVFQRPLVAGSVIATVETLCSPVVVTFRPPGFPKPEARGQSPVEPMPLDVQSKAARVSANERGGGGRPDLTQAKIVVTGGRPLKDAQTFESVIGGLADALGGAVGATRAAVDSGIAPNEAQVGQTGKIVAPDLYIAAGVSGSTQHMAGIKDSKIIVAINKDPDAPIFETADLGIVADLYEAIPAIRRLIGK